MTEDWHKSLLYTNLKRGVSIELSMTVKELNWLAKKPPRDEEALKLIILKGIHILNQLLKEMLGTKEDIQRFEERYKVLSAGHVRALMEKCLGLIEIKKKTEDILKDIILRESIMKNLEISYNNVKEKVLQVYKLNKMIRIKILEWTKDESIPFDAFVFKGNKYLDKISEELVTLQGYLASPHILYTQN